MNEDEIAAAISVRIQSSVDQKVWDKIYNPRVASTHLWLQVKDLTVNRSQFYLNIQDNLTKGIENYDIRP